MFRQPPLSLTQSAAWRCVEEEEGHKDVDAPEIYQWATGLWSTMEATEETPSKTGYAATYRRLPLAFVSKRPEEGGSQMQMTYRYPVLVVLWYQVVVCCQVLGVAYHQSCSDWYSLSDRATLLIWYVYQDFLSEGVFQYDRYCTWCGINCRLEGKSTTHDCANLMAAQANIIYGCLAFLRLKESFLWAYYDT